METRLVRVFVLFCVLWPERRDSRSRRGRQFHYGCAGDLGAYQCLQLGSLAKGMHFQLDDEAIYGAAFGTP